MQITENNRQKVPLFPRPILGQPVAWWLTCLDLTELTPGFESQTQKLEKHLSAGASCVSSTLEGGRNGREGIVAWPSLRGGAFLLCLSLSLPPVSTQCPPAKEKKKMSNLSSNNPLSVFRDNRNSKPSTYPQTQHYLYDDCQGIFYNFFLVFVSQIQFVFKCQ